VVPGATYAWEFGNVKQLSLGAVPDRATRGHHASSTSDSTLGVTHGALARACHAAYEGGSPGRAWNLLRRPGGRLRRFVNRGDVI